MDGSVSNTAGPSGTQSSILPNDPRLTRCGFAKLQGDGIEFFIRKYEITMGRTSKNSTLDLILGDSTTISRQHASIRYNFDAKCFELVVLGKNGVQVESSGNGVSHVYTPDSPPTPLRSRDLLIMGEKRFYFLLPRSMGGPARKRRRVEPSPASGAVNATALSAHPASLPPGPAQLALPSTYQIQPAAHMTTALQQPSQHSASVGGALHSSSLPSQQQSESHPQSQSQSLQHHQHHHHPNAAQGGMMASRAPQMTAFANQQDEDDALINAGSLPYDNGTSYGYGTGTNGGFPGGF